MAGKFIVETQEEEHGGWNDWSNSSEFSTLEEAVVEARRRGDWLCPSRVVQVFGEWPEKPE